MKPTTDYHEPTSDGDRKIFSTIRPKECEKIIRNAQSRRKLIEFKSKFRGRIAVIELVLLFTKIKTLLLVWELIVGLRRITTRFRRRGQVDAPPLNTAVSITTAPQRDDLLTRLIVDRDRVATSIRTAIAARIGTLRFTDLGPKGAGWASRYDYCSALAKHPHTIFLVTRPVLGCHIQHQVMGIVAVLGLDERRFQEFVRGELNEFDIGSLGIRDEPSNYLVVSAIASDPKLATRTYNVNLFFHAIARALALHLKGSKDLPVIAAEACSREGQRLCRLGGLSAALNDSGEIRKTPNGGEIFVGDFTQLATLDIREARRLIKFGQLISLYCRCGDTQPLNQAISQSPTGPALKRDRTTMPRPGTFSRDASPKKPRLWKRNHPSSPSEAPRRTFDGDYETRD